MMEKIILKKPIVIIGAMGTGKSTIGKKLAYRLDVQFYDSDQVIEHQEGLSVVDIFDFRGEEYFLQKERETIPMILNYGPIVLSTGGNTFLDPEIRQHILDNAICIWLKSDFNTLYRRITKRNTRPHFLDTDNPKQVLRELMEMQQPIYQQADIIVDSNNLEKFQITDVIMLKLKQLLQG